MTEHDNPDGPCSCGAWHKPGETDTPEQELRESAEQPYPFNDLEKRYAAELLRVRKERNDYLGCLEVVLRDINCPTSRSWHCRNNYRQIPVQDIMRAVEELLSVEQNKNRQLKADLESARRERDTVRSELSAVMQLAVDKWLDDEEGDPATRAARAREVALKEIEALEIERDAFCAECDDSGTVTKVDFPGEFSNMYQEPCSKCKPKSS